MRLVLKITIVQSRVNTVHEISICPKPEMASYKGDKDDSFDPLDGSELLSFLINMML